MRDEFEARLSDSENQFNSLIQESRQKTSALLVMLRDKEDECKGVQDRFIKLNNDIVELRARSETILKAFHHYRDMVDSHVKPLFQAFDKIEVHLNFLEHSKRWKIGDKIGTYFRLS